ncbi:MAG: hypothetical protein U0269_36010 [Polyangiales bacterium]
MGSTSITGFFSPETAAISPIAFDQPATYNVRFMDAPVVGYIHANAACSMDEPSASTGAPALCGLSFVTGCE